MLEGKQSTDFTFCIS